MAYTCFLNGLKNGRCKYSLAEQKETSLAEALRNATYFVRVTEICVESMNTSKKAKTPIDRNAGRGDKRLLLNVGDSRFTVDLRSILMEVKGHPMLRRPQPMATTPKPHNAQKYG